MKQCTRCIKWKIDSEFSKNSKNKDGLRYWCKKCERADMRECHNKEGKALKTYYRYEECHRVFDGVKQKRCRKCKSWKAESRFYKYSRHKDGLTTWCKECLNKATNKARKKQRTAMRN